ncbi:hypothetical protein ACVWXN_002249 [Bradyrhizobium sp. i1.4.4]
MVVVNGSTYVCIVSHTSGTFATDLAAGKWILVAQAAPIYNVTSTASLAIAIASKAFTGVATNNAYQIGDYVRAKSNANAANYLEGNVTANSAGTLTVNVTKLAAPAPLRTGISRRPVRPVSVTCSKRTIFPGWLTL